MRVLFRTKIFYHSTSIFAIAPSMDRNYIEIFSIICYNIYVLVLFPINI